MSACPTWRVVSWFRWNSTQRADCLRVDCRWLPQITDDCDDPRGELGCLGVVGEHAIQRLLPDQLEVGRPVMLPSRPGPLGSPSMDDFENPLREAAEAGYVRLT